MNKIHYVSKEDFTVDDVFDRGSKVIEMAIEKGTVGLRSFVETDEKTEMRGFEALKKVRDKYAFAIAILNAFTPYGDASLIRMADRYANIAQLSTDDEIEDTFAMISKNAAKLLSFETEIKIGAAATLVVIEAKDTVEAIRTSGQALAGFKNGKQTFCNAAAHICFE